MKLIDALAAGMVGAAGGTCKVYRRGTTTNATTYSDFVGATNITASSYALDSNGRKVLYVNEVVTVVVYDSAGAEVTTYTDGETASSLDVINAHFTGANYTTGATGVSLPLRLEALLDLAYTSFGANDWKVPVNGVDTLLKNAISTAGIVYNVMAPTYGAVGNGTADDTTAIAAAITAATSAGGVIFFPPGTYRITSALTLPINVSLWGCGPGASILAMDHASNDWITASGTSVYRSQVRGLRFKALQSCSGQNFEDTNGLMLIDFDNCEFAESTGSLITVAKTSRYNFTRCVFKPGGTTSDCFTSTATTGDGPTHFTNCRFVAPSSAYNTTNAMVYGNRVMFDACDFDMSGMTSGTALCIATRTGESIIANCDFKNPTGGTVNAWNPGTLANATDVAVETRNRFGTGVRPIISMADTGSTILGSRVGKCLSITCTTATCTITNTRDYDTVFVDYTYAGNAQFTITSAAVATPTVGSKLHLIVFNNASGAARTPTFSGTYFTGTAQSIGNNAVGSWLFCWLPTAVGGGTWVQCADEVAF